MLCGERSESEPTFCYVFMGMAMDKLNVPDRPESVALVTALEDAIYNIAPEKMTPIEVLGCLDMVSKKFYEAHLFEYEVSE